MHPIESELNRLVEMGLPGAFVYVEDADRTTQFYTAGFADLGTQRRMTPDSHYRIGSTTKTFTAVVTLQLIAEGKLALHDHLQTWLPELVVPNASHLTIEQLLRMRSGLFDFEDDPSLLDDLDAHLQPVSLQHAVHLGVKHPAIFTPGAKFTYCNTNYCLLEMIIERVTGNSLATEFERRIFKPLGLESTRYPAEDDLTLPEPYIRGYDRLVDGWRECSRTFFGRGDGAIISTAVDVARFFRALLLEDRLLPPPLLQLMMTVIPDEPPPDMAYGLGLIRDSLSCGDIWGHSGRGYGYGHMPFLRLSTGRFAIFMLNGTYGFHLPADAARPQRPRFTPEFRAEVYC